MTARMYSGWAFDSDYHLIVAGGIVSADVNDVWRSTISFNDTMTLARTCGCSDSTIIPRQPGLQYWPMDNVSLS
jgi:hypothetical protein